MRWLGAAVLMASATLGCGGSRLGDDPTKGFTAYRQHADRKLDLLFMVDNSSGPEIAQVTLRANIPRFMDVLKALPEGLPDLHVAVVTSDMGVGHTDIPGCTVDGERGVFHFGVGAGAAGCTTTGLDPGATFVTTTGGFTPQSNFTGDITAVLQCIVPVGAYGCGFEQPLASVVRALGADGAPPPPENVGFLRPEAYLGIVLLTDEDDCSAKNPSFFDIQTNTNIASMLGPPGNFRCSEFGHICDGAHPRRTAPTGAVTDTMSYTSCTSDENGLLKPVGQFVDQISALKAHPSQISVASIQGPVTPYQIGWKSPAVMTDPPWPEIRHSCTMSVGTAMAFADAGVRIAEFARAFDGGDDVYSVCQDNFGPALNTLATKLSVLIAPPCINAGNSAQPDCTVIDRVPKPGGGNVDTPIASCDATGGAVPCWRLRAPFATETCEAGKSILQVERAQPTPNDALLLVKCAG